MNKNTIFRQTGRIEYIDIFRAFGIILMVMGHIGFGGEFDHFIHAFHMPMFFFVSGFLYKSRTIPFLSFLRKKAKSLLIPYFVFGLFHYLYFTIYNGFQLEPIKALLLFPTSGNLPIAGALWFLLALFIADVIYYWINRIKNSSIICMIVILISFAGQFLPTKLGVRVPFAIAPALVGIGLMHIGRLLRPYEQRIVNLKVYLVLLFGAITVLSIMQSEYVNMRAGIYPRSLFVFWINAVLASIIGLSISSRIKQWFKNTLLNRYLQSIGRNSIVYVCLNQIVILLSGKIISKGFNLLSFSIESSLLIKIIELVASLVVLFLLSLLFEKTLLRAFVGRFNVNTHSTDSV